MTQPDDQLEIAGPRILILGGAGSGKSTLARAAAKHYSVEHHELDWLAWRRDTTGGLLSRDELLSLAGGIADQPSWVVDGAYTGWTRSLADRAHVVVWLNVPLRVALWRIFWRHVKAEIRRNNRFPGWRSLFRFMRMVRHQYRGEWQDYGPSSPSPSPANFENFVAEFADKSIRCRSMSLGELLDELEARGLEFAQTPVPR